LDLTFFLPALCYSGLLSLLGLALLLRHRASGIPDFSLVLNVGLGVIMTAVAVVSGFNLYVGPVLALGAGALLGAVEYRGAIWFTERRGDDAVRRTMLTIGLLIIGQALLACFTYWTITNFPRGAFTFHLMNMYDFHVFDYSGIFLVIPLVCVSVYLLFSVLGRRWRFWALLTASEESTELSMIQGIDELRVRIIVWSLSGGLACLAGSLFPAFLHLTPGNETIILIPLFAVFVLGGYESALLTVIAGYLVGFTELYGTFGGQIIFGTWFGEYRPLISMAFIYFGLLLMPRGLPELGASLQNAASYLRRNQENAVKVVALVLVILGFSTIALNAQMTSLIADKDGWISVANQIGVAGATIYSDGADPRLLERQYFDTTYPTTIFNVRNIDEFTSMIKARNLKIVYLHEGKLYIILDPGQGYVYDPGSDNFGR